MSLPKGWILPKLGDITTYKKGKKPKVLQEVEGIDTVPYIDIKAFEKGIIRQYADIESSVLVSENDFLVVWDGARSGLTGRNIAGALGSTLMKVKAPGLDNDYIFRFLQFKFTDINSNTKGTGIPHVDPAYLWNIELPLAPFNEQKRIANKLDELLPTVENIKTRLDNASLILKRFRQSILSAATSGELTEQWRKENFNISFSTIDEEEIMKLVDSYHDIRCTQAIEKGKRKPKHPRANKKSNKVNSILPKIPESWKYIRLEDITYLVSDGTHQTPKYVEEGVPFFSVKNVRPFKINDKNIKYVSEEEFAIIDARCNSNFEDILYTKVGATFGYAAMNTINYKHTIYVSLALIKPVKEYFCSKYAEITMNSNTVFNQAKERVSGSGVPDLHLIEIRDFKIPIPPLIEQKEIVSKVESLFLLVDTLEGKIEAAKNRVDKLTQSILLKAFNGELVPQDSTDELAEKLLEQIKNDQKKEKTKKVTKKTKKKTNKVKKNKDLLLILKTEDKVLTSEELLQLSSFSNNIENIEDFFVQLQKLKVEKKINIERKDNKDLISLVL